ncbi:MAG: hypothetical protein IPP72_20640 [Chitinophagaceae bacterium]|nr:hypothetical protein [Chitinophagaceae bacterium]
MKKILSVIVFAATCFIATAQIKKPVSADAAFSESLSKIVLDFTYNFINIQGSRMPAEVDADTYQSKVCLPGALGCKVMRYHSVEDKSANWQAAVYAGDSFEEAVKMYKKIFGQIKKTSVKGIAAAGSGFDGKMDAVDENVGFAVSSLRLKTKDKRYINMVAEVEITSGYTGWEVHLNVYTKKIVEEKEEMQ